MSAAPSNTNYTSFSNDRPGYGISITLFLIFFIALLAPLIQGFYEKIKFFFFYVYSFECLKIALNENFVTLKW